MARPADPAETPVQESALKSWRALDREVLTSIHQVARNESVFFCSCIYYYLLIIGILAGTTAEHVTQPLAVYRVWLQPEASLAPYFVQ